MFADCSVLMSIYYKCPKYHFIECLDSIKLQTLLPSQLVIIQDGEMPYEIKDVLSQYNNFDIKLIVNEKNMGLPYSLNLGLSYCKYDLVFRMDADDVCEINRIEIQYKEMISNEKLIILGSNVSLINYESEIINHSRKIPLNNKEIRKNIYIKNPFNHPSVVFRKSKLLDVGGYANLFLYEDWYLWIKLTKNKDNIFKNIDDNLLKYRIRSFYDRNGLKIIKAEYLFYKKLFYEKHINFFVFTLIIITKSIVRILPNRLYIQLKHLFDKFK
jgi:glycosyltransferase involved in cell wall biosynthesis